MVCQDQRPFTPLDVAPQVGERVREALAAGSRGDAKRAAGASFFVGAVFVREQAPHRAFDGQAPRRVGVLHPAAQFQAEPGLRVASVMALPYLHGRVTLWPSGHTISPATPSRPLLCRTTLY